jgi:hypothetical protein
MVPRVERWLTESPVPVLVYCTIREPWEQAQLFAQGRSADQLASAAARLRGLGLEHHAKILEQQPPAPGRRVTNAPPGLSFHQPHWLGGVMGGLALDFVPILGGKPLWKDAARYEAAATAAEKVGLTWSGRWQTFRETAHLQWDMGGEVKILPLAQGAYRLGGVTL